MITAITVPFPGAKRPLEEGAKLGLWDLSMLESQETRIPVSDAYILGAWHDVYEGLLVLSNVGVLWTSSPGEMDFTPVEQGYLARIVADPRVKFIWFGDPSLARIYPQKGFYAPYPLVYQAENIEDSNREEIVTLFCPTKPAKNIYNQLLAVEMVQRERNLVLHTNIHGFDEILASINHVRYGWLPDREYRELIARASINLGVGWSETFCYQVAEALMLGTPSVKSPSVPVPGLECAPHNAREIASGINELLAARSMLTEAYMARLSSLANTWNADLTRILKSHNLL